MTDRNRPHARVTVTKAEAHWIKTLVRRAIAEGRTPPAAILPDPEGLYGKFNLAWGGDDPERLAEFGVERIPERVDSYDPDARRPSIGSRWTWQPQDTTARETVVVTNVRWNGEEWYVTTDGPSGVWIVDLSRFWEAVRWAPEYAPEPGEPVRSPWAPEHAPVSSRDRDARIPKEGSWWRWMPNGEAIVVLGATWNGEEWFVRSAAVDVDGTYVDPCWNDLGRFYEAAVPQHESSRD